VNIDTEDAWSEEAEEGDPHDHIARLEVRLEELAESRERCRKFNLVSQIAMAGGGLWLAAATIGVISLDPLGLMAAIAAVIGGTVMYGSNATTAREIEAAIKEAEAQRTVLIESLELREVGGRQR
jgi:hypothetical protein